MQPRELFGVGVRLTGVIAVVLGLPPLFSFSLVGFLQASAQIVAGLILMTRTDQVIDICYPTRDSRSSERDDSPDR